MENEKLLNEAMNKSLKKIMQKFKINDLRTFVSYLDLLHTKNLKKNNKKFTNDILLEFLKELENLFDLANIINQIPINPN